VGDVIEPEVRIGHVHLKVADIERSLAFYCGILGFEVMQRNGDEAAFISAGGYHHHLGFNTWESKGGSPPPPGTTGLYHVAILYPTRAALGDALKQAGIPAGEITAAAVSGTSPRAARKVAAALGGAGATVVDRGSVVTAHMAEVVRGNAGRLLSRQDVQAMIEGLRYEEPLLAQEVGSDLLPVSTLQGVLRGLLAEQVPVRDLSRIVDTVATRSLQTRVLDHLVAAARVAVGGAIVAKLAPEGTLAVITLDPAFEASLLADLREIDGETRLGKCALPGKHVRVNGVHQSAIEIKDESAHHEGLLPSRFPAGLRRLPRRTAVCDYALRPALV